MNLDGSFNYTPNPNFVGTDSFSYRVNDGLANSNIATVVINVTAENDAPLAGNDTYTTNANSTLTVAVANGVLGNDGDPEGSTLTAQLVTNPQHGAVSFNPNGSFSYTPAGGFTGTDAFSYRVRDIQGATSNTAIVSIEVSRNAPWQNTRNSLDASNDGSVSPIDALAIINRLNQFGPGPLPAPGPDGPPPYFDTTGDNQITALDALLVINFLNGSGGEGEFAAASQLVLPDFQQESLAPLTATQRQQLQQNLFRAHWQRFGVTSCFAD